MMKLQLISNIEPRIKQKVLMCKNTSPGAIEDGDATNE